MDHSKTDLTRVALAIVTDLVLNHPGGVAQFGVTEFAAVIGESQMTDQDLVLGFLNLATILLVKLENAGHPMQDVLADIGRTWSS